MIQGFQPKAKQIIYIMTADGLYSKSIVATREGTAFVLFDEVRVRKVMEAVESAEMTTPKFIAEAIETYLQSVESALCFPELECKRSS